MSLVKPNLIHVVKKQLIYKLRAYNQAFFTLVVIQLIAVFFSFNGVGGSGGRRESIEVSVHYYTADIVVILTMVWAFITAILLTTKAYRYDDFSFVTNRISSNLSNILFLLGASIIGGTMAMLSPYLMKVITHYFLNKQYMNSPSEMAVPVKLLLGIISTSSYVFLSGAFGYFVGTLVQINKVFVLLLPAIFFGALIVEGSGKAKIVTTAFNFLFMESSFPFFILKILIIISVLFSITFILTNRMEVRQ